MHAFRFLFVYGIACVAENKHPPFTRRWEELERLFMKKPAFNDGVFVQSWALMDFPFGPERQTMLDYFEQFCATGAVGTQFQQFITEARRSRLGLYEDAGRSITALNFCELISSSGAIPRATPRASGRWSSSTCAASSTSSTRRRPRRLSSRRS